MRQLMGQFNRDIKSQSPIPGLAYSGAEHGRAKGIGQFGTKHNLITSINTALQFP